MPILAFGGSFLQYWAEKWLLLRRCKTPEKIGGDIAMTFINMLPLMMYLYAFSILVFELLIIGDSTHGLISISLVTLSLLIRGFAMTNICFR
jgi:hypothetical protein